MSVKIKRWGNSLGVRIPKAIIDKVKLKENVDVEIESKNGAIIIFPSKKEYSLDTLLDQITKDNLHVAQDFKVEGNEVW